MSYQIKLNFGLEVLVSGHQCEVKNNHGRTVFCGNAEEVAKWTDERGITGWMLPAQPVFPIEKLRVDPDDVVLLTPTQVRRIVKISSDAPNFRARLDATAGGRKIFMLMSYRQKGSRKETLYRCSDGLHLTTGKPPSERLSHAKFKGRGFIVTASA
jgi:hypothetical protein